MTEIRVKDLAVGDRIHYGPAVWVVETITDLGGVVLAIGTDGKGDRFSLRRRPHDCVWSS